MIEFYQAYADYNDLMDLTEAMLRDCCWKVLSTTIVTYQGSELRLWRTICSHDYVGVYSSLQPRINGGRSWIIRKCNSVAKNLKIDVKPIWGLGKLLDRDFRRNGWKQTGSTTFITEYQRKSLHWRVVMTIMISLPDRFEFFVADVNC